MRYLIIGNSAAGINAAESIRLKDKKGRITIVSDETSEPYCRILTSNFIAGEIKYPGMLMRTGDFYRQSKIELIPGKKAACLFVKRKIIQLSDGKKIPYDKLLIATGSSPVFLDIPGIKLKGVFGLRKIDDAMGIVGRMPKTKRAVIIGGGLVSCKAAYSLLKRGKKITMVVSSDRILSQMLDDEGSLIIKKKTKALGIEVRFGTDVKEISGREDVRGVILKDGSKINCEMVIVGRGVKPNTDFLNPASRIGVKIEKGVVVNEYLNTNIQDIYAAGDVAQGRDLLYNDSRINAMWPNAVLQGRIAGLNMAGEKIDINGTYALNIGTFFGIPAVSIGISRPPSGLSKFMEITFNHKYKNEYKKFVIRDNKLVGYINIGDVAGAGFINNLINSEMEIGGYLNDIKIRRNNISLVLKKQHLNSN